jgi:uncharacterized heparinase superfamily protein
MMGLGTYYRTARYTRWSQLIWRARYALERRRPLRSDGTTRWVCRDGKTPCLRDDFPDMPLFHTAAFDAAQAADLLRRGVFCHLSQAKDVGRERPDWRLGPVASDRLWTITLHYHAWAHHLAQIATGELACAGQAAVLFEHYLFDWMSRSALDTPGARHLAWNAYAIATRITWWIRSYRLLGRYRFQSWGRFGQEFLHSLWQQAAYLHDHLEWDLRGNHLLRDAVGLAWAGRFFAAEQARTWLARATRLALDQAAEQVLPDGGHFERSPMYHLHIMEDILSLTLLVEESAARRHLSDTWLRMAECLAWLRHPDGKLALFNDGGLDAACEPDRMLQLGERLGVAVDAGPRQGGRYFPDSGMVVWHGQLWTVFFDVGLVGPDYQPGHAHADTLAIECSYAGKRLFVDPGCFAYDNDARRRYDRATASHNTVCIDHADSSEVWHIFRVGRRARPVDVKVQEGSARLLADASHTGYDHLTGRPRHHRELVVDDRNLAIIDRIDGGGNHSIEGGFTMAPDWRVRLVTGGWELACNGRRVLWRVVSKKELRLSMEPAMYHPTYGLEMKTLRLVWRYEGSLPLTVKCIAETV